MTRSHLALRYITATRSRTPNPPVEILLPHESESGLATKAEMRMLQEWFEALIPDGMNELPPKKWMNQWLSTRLPFNFQYGSENSSKLLNRWQLERAEWRRLTYQTRRVQMDGPLHRPAGRLGHKTICEFPGNGVGTLV